MEQLANAPPIRTVPVPVPVVTELVIPVPEFPDVKVDVPRDAVLADL